MSRKDKNRWAFDKKESQEVEKKRLKNNLLGIMVIILILILTLDVGGCSTSLTEFLLK